MQEFLHVLVGSVKVLAVDTLGRCDADQLGRWRVPILAREVVLFAERTRVAFVAFLLALATLFTGLNKSTST